MHLSQFLRLVRALLIFQASQKLMSRTTRSVVITSSRDHNDLDSDVANRGNVCWRRWRRSFKHILFACSLADRYSLWKVAPTLAIDGFYPAVIAKRALSSYPHVQRFVLRKQYGKLGRFYLSHKFLQQRRPIILPPD